MPSIVWDYFDEFEGGGKCRLCGCVRNRKDKSTSTFWQHLERVHRLDKRQMLSNGTTGASSVKATKSSSLQPDSSNIPNGKRRATSDVDPTITEAQNNDVEAVVAEEPAEKMPKLELMASMSELDQRATEETFKFISDLLLKQQQQQQHQNNLTNSSSSASPSPPTPTIAAATTSSQIHQKNCQQQERNNFMIQSLAAISPIGINTQNCVMMNNGGNPSPLIDVKMKFEPNLTVVQQSRPPSLNDYLNGLFLVDNTFNNTSTSLRSDFASQTSSNLSMDKSKSSTTVTESPTTKKRSDYLAWDEFFMGTALLAAQRSKDPSTQVGSCIVKDNIIVGIGYNGMPIGCNDDEMPWGKRNSDADPLNTKTFYVCHAEMNAILNKNCADIRDSTLYTTLFPCCECAKLIIQSRIKHVVYLKDKSVPEMEASRRLFDITSIKYSQFEPTRSAITIRFK